MPLRRTALRSNTAGASGLHRRVPVDQHRLSARTARYGLPLLIAVIVLVSFCPLFGNDFVNWDDPFYFVDRRYYGEFSLPRLQWMFTTLHMSHYQPLFWLVHDLLHSIGGMKPVYYHGTNLLLHAVNAVLLYYVIMVLQRGVDGRAASASRLAVPVSAALGALFFAIHPLRVEAVAWAVELGEMLCAAFCLMAVLAYLRMQSANGARGTPRMWYLLSVGCFALSLLSKATSMALPIVLLVMDIYPLRRLERGSGRTTSWTHVLIEKVPYVLLSGGAATLVLLAKHQEAMATLTEHGAAARGMQAFYGLCFYLWKSMVPFQLSPLYLLHKPLDATAARFIFAAIMVLGATIGLFCMRRHWPAALAAWACYVLLLAPVSGIVQSGPQITADRYTYLACLPWSVLIAAGVYRSLHASTWAAGRWRLAGATAVVLMLLLLSVRTNQQTRIWKDSLTLWTHVLSIEPNNYLAYNNRGEARYAANDVDGALLDFNRAIELNPSYDNAYQNRGTARLAKGDASGALADYDKALRLNPRYSSAYYNRGNIRKTNGDLDGALADYQQALAIAPDYAVAYNARGRIYQAQGNLDAALADFTRAIQLDPAYANAYNNRSSVRSVQGDLVGAIADCAEALRLSPANAPHRDVFERNLARLRAQLAERSKNR